MAAQRHTHTAPNRYPGIFRTVRAWLESKRTPAPPPLRILSFGCSSGDEMLTLRAYFPEATIVGCDTNLEMLRRSKRTLRGDQGFTFFSTPENVAAFGPYDAVFAMSVLCQFPESRNADNLNSLFPFSLFETLAGNLASNIRPGGVFCLFNANYLFRDLKQATDFVSLRSEHIHTTGFIDRFSPDGSRLTQSDGHRDAFLQIPQQNTPLTDDDLIDCLHIRKTDEVNENQYLNVSNTNEPAGFDAKGETALSGLSHEEAAGRGGISSQLFSANDANDEPWIRYRWRKMALDGNIIEFQPWYIRADDISRNTLTDEQTRALEDTEQKTSQKRVLAERLLSKLRRR